jgi:hypothetical protein
MVRQEDKTMTQDIFARKIEVGDFVVPVHHHWPAWPSKVSSIGQKFLTLVTETEREYTFRIVPARVMKLTME